MVILASGFFQFLLIRRIVHKLQMFIIYEKKKQIIWHDRKFLDIFLETVKVGAATREILRSYIHLPETLVYKRYLPSEGSSTSSLI